MKRSLTAFIVFCNAALVAQNYGSGQDYLKQIHSRNYKGTCQCYAFSQKNTHYTADTVSGHSEWHEEIRLPDFFKIQFGDITKGNFVIFRNDSIYNFKTNKLIKSGPDSSTLLLILGGMYYRSFEDVKIRLITAGYNITLFGETNWNGEDVWILGESAETAEKKLGNQIWFSKKDDRVLRIIEKTPRGLMDMRFESHQKWCRGFVETKVSFRMNGKLEQVEAYYDLREIPCTN